jgi:XPA protein C-terminus
MGLTEEQKERIRKNREIALELRKKRKLENRTNGDETEQCMYSRDKDDSESKRCCRAMDQSGKKECLNTLTNDNDGYVAEEIEEFEEGASEYVTKIEAMKMYCLPIGTLDVCSYIEKPNPKNSSWNTMKLFYRSEIRQRAHKRYGGLNGLVAERQKRNHSRFEKDMEKSKNVFR